LDTCSKNDVISFSRKGYCALGLELGLGLGLGLGLEIGLGLGLMLGLGLGLMLGLELAEIRLNTFSVKRLLFRLNQMMYYALRLSYHSNTEAVLLACLSAGWCPFGWSNVHSVKCTRSRILTF